MVGGASGGCQQSRHVRTLPWLVALMADVSLNRQEVNAVDPALFEFPAVYIHTFDNQIADSLSHMDCYRFWHLVRHAKWSRQLPGS